MARQPELSATELIIKKRDKSELSVQQIQGFVSGFMAGQVADYQMSAFLMATLLNGMSDRETVALTDALLNSGSVLDLGRISGFKVDKHSTGGVGDKVSLCLAPLVAACGVKVPMISGRGLGHTGGTLDKLEAIAGYDTRLSAKRFAKVVETVGVSIIGQTEQLAPADRRIYALRDVTGTVESIPLIVASILSKKLAEGIDGLVLDVKVGRGAFMKDLDSARALARALVRVGRRAGKQVTALLTDMDTPLGLTAGNALELREAIDILRGQGPEDTWQVTLALGVEMLRMARVAPSASGARALMEQARTSGQGFEVFLQMVRAQGGDTRMVERPELLPRAKSVLELQVEQAGVVRDIDPLELGRVCVAIGAGRRRAEDAVDFGAGVELVAKPGTKVARGDVLALVHTDHAERDRPLLERLSRAFTVGRSRAKASPLIIERLAR